MGHSKLERILKELRWPSWVKESCRESHWIHQGKDREGNKTGRKFYILLKPELIMFSLYAYTFKDGEVCEAGAYHAYLDHHKEHQGGKDPGAFLDLPEIPREQPLYQSTVGIHPDYQGQGLGGVLFSLLTEELQSQEAFHVVGFTSMGKERLMPKFKAMGYEHCRVHPEAEVPLRLANVTDWMFFDYSSEGHD